MNNMTSLFLAQSYHDAWDDYLRSRDRERFARWDYVILTASDEDQAKGFRAQISERQQAGVLNAWTHFAVLPDPEGKRVGSGGATLNVLSYIAEREGSDDFRGKRILVIHSGGDSKRVPQYSALGKLFSPVPRELPNGRPSTLFDEFMIGMSSVPGRIKEGMLVLSGDVLLLFNSLQIDFAGEGAAAISFKKEVETGKNHGVFLRGEDGCVANFLHKQTVETLTACGAVNEHGKVDIDTGAVIFSAAMLTSLFGLISTDGKNDSEKFGRFVNERARLSFYGDFLYPLATNSTLEQFYQEKPEGSFCEELRQCRESVWEALRPYRLKLLRLSPAEFIHFGTTREIMALMNEQIGDYECLGWSRQVAGSAVDAGAALYNSVVSAQASVGSGCYFEVSDVRRGAVIGSNVLLSYITVENRVIPSDVVLHGLKKKNGRFTVRIYGIHDNPKDTLEQNGEFLGVKLRTFLNAYGMKEEELWPQEEHYLWFADLYPEADSIAEALDEALRLYRVVRAAQEGEAGAEREEFEAWRAARRESLCAGFHEADPGAVLEWNSRLHRIVQMDSLGKLIRAGGSAQEAAALLKGSVPDAFQRQWIEEKAQKAGFSERIRLYYYMGRVLGGSDGESYYDRCFGEIREAILRETLDGLHYRSDIRIAHEEAQTCLPLRVNWGGGWSDTPPYCNEHGGTVLNAALKLNGELPVCVTMRRLPEKKVVFDSRDMDTHGEFTELAPLQDCSNPYDPFALQKAALIACGIIPAQTQSAAGDGQSVEGTSAGENRTESGQMQSAQSGEGQQETTLDAILTRIGGGIFLSTEVTGVPKGSGLGTSSILSGACVKTIFDFFGVVYTESELYDHVLCMEQIMSTGGGWQDQVGGLSEGIKYITSRPGLRQSLKVEHLTLSPETMRELNERFVLIYTGQRRLARNLLRDVVGRYIGANPDALYVLEEIQKLSALMRFELERGNVDGFTALLNRHWELSKQLDGGSTNTCIDQIFLTIDDLLDGKMISGAGGGGFLQGILKKGVTRGMVRERLRRVFQDSGVDVWDCELI
ncbi:MAG: L-fucokinase [Eubacteriales bacterium]|nr:L-fucokinase [Eubacteriales bacterium]